MIINHCEFCNEFSDKTGNAFNQLYGKDARRIIDIEGDVVAIPSIGQIFPGSIMILPVDHYETMASSSKEVKHDSLKLLDRLTQKCNQFGLPLIFEHGAMCKTGGGCGIYHAHLHIVPVPHSVESHDLLPGSTSFHESLLEAFCAINNAEQYLLIQDTSGKVASKILTSSDSLCYPSQYFRQKVAQHFKSENPWDWKAYKREDSLWRTVECYKNVESSSKCHVHY